MSGTELVGGAIGSTLLGLGAAAVLAWALHRGGRDRTLLFFGLWCGLYGARLVAEQDTIVALIGVSNRASEYFGAAVTYVINVPVGLFLEALIGPGWKRSVRRIWQVQAVYAVLAILGDLVLARPRAMMPLNSPIVLAGIVTAFANLWIYRSRLTSTFRSPAMGAAAVIMLLFVINENLGRPVLPPVNIEPVGVFTFVVTLGYSVVARIFRQEAELVAVQRELDTARRIQTALLPKGAPRVDRLELAARYVPMNAVAGDLYDFVSLGPSRAGILVADVSGHGVPAALVASMVKLAFTTQAEHAADPARVLTAMNRAICRNVEGTFVTAVYAVVDTQQRTLIVANAGHPPLLIGRCDGSVKEGVQRGFMLGLTADAAYGNEEWPLHPGDRILLYTDGIPEAQNPKGEFLDAHRLSEWLTSENAADADALADSVLGNLQVWRGVSGFDDDVTFVVARVADP